MPMPSHDLIFCCVRPDVPGMSMSHSHDASPLLLHTCKLSSAMIGWSNKSHLTTYGLCACQSLLHGTSLHVSCYPLATYTVYLQRSLELLKNRHGRL
uniref:Uncharacterized protein n=1 Tax=Oryza brachyantha TaxID=4533 RepID=J3MMU9_ORYBR